MRQVPSSLPGRGCTAEMNEGWGRRCSRSRSSPQRTGTDRWWRPFRASGRHQGPYHVLLSTHWAALMAYWTAHLMNAVLKASLLLHLNRDFYLFLLTLNFASWWGEEESCPISEFLPSVHHPSPGQGVTSVSPAEAGSTALASGEKTPPRRRFWSIFNFPAWAT